MTTIEPVWTQRPTRPLGWWGMLLGVATEATLFATLIASYFYIRFKTVGWPPEGIAKPHVLLPCVLTGVLVASSVPMLIAARRRFVRGTLLAAFLLGLVYALLQAWQLDRDWGRFHAAKDAYASLYYTLTGLLWAHVVAGLLLLLFVLYQAWNPAYSPQRSAGVQVAALYVHFVNAVALAILLAVYLSPQL